jgi:hypothetical protein
LVNIIKDLNLLINVKKTFRESLIKEKKDEIKRKLSETFSRKFNQRGKSRRKK